MISSTPSGGTGMLAVLCDLEPQWHREFREWLRDDMMPARMRIGGFPAAATYDRIEAAEDNTAGTEPFATIYETDSIGDLYGAPYQALRANRDQRDKDFHARFLKPARYTLSWVGPELVAGSLPPSGGGAGGGAKPDTGRSAITPSPALPHKGGGSPIPFSPVAVIDRLDIPDTAIQAFNMWLSIEYLPALETVPGLVRFRRYLAMEGQPRHILVHELASQDALSAPGWRAARQMLSGQTPASRISGAYRRVLSVTSA